MLSDYIEDPAPLPKPCAGGCGRDLRGVGTTVLAEGQEYCEACAPAPLVRQFADGEQVRVRSDDDPHHPYAGFVGHVVAAEYQGYWRTWRYVVSNDEHQIAVEDRHLEAVAGRPLPQLKVFGGQVQVRNERGLALAGMRGSTFGARWLPDQHEWCYTVIVGQGRYNYFESQLEAAPKTTSRPGDNAPSAPASIPI